MGLICFLICVKQKAYSAKVKRWREKCKSDACDSSAFLCVRVCVCVCLCTRIVLSINWGENCCAFSPVVSYLDNPPLFPLLLFHTSSLPVLDVRNSLYHLRLLSFHGCVVSPYRNVLWRKVSYMTIKVAIMLYCLSRTNAILMFLYPTCTHVKRAVMSELLCDMRIWKSCI